MGIMTKIALFPLAHIYAGIASLGMCGFWFSCCTEPHERSAHVQNDGSLDGTLIVLILCGHTGLEYGSARLLRLYHV